MTKTINVPAGSLSRAGIFETEGDGEEKKMRVSISSDVPYLRYDYWADEEFYETLSHEPGDISDGRLKSGLPALYNHQRDSHIGRARSFTNDGHRITVSDIIFSDNPDAQEKKRDIDSGVLVDTSVGYTLLDDGECVGAKDGIPIYKFKWEPHEFSFVTIPADFSVGVGRQRDHKPEGEPRKISVRTKEGVDVPRNKAQTPKQKSMAEPAEPPAEVKINVAEREAGAMAFRDTCKKIREWAGAIKNPQWKEAALEVAARHMDLKNPDYGEFLDEARSKFEGVVALTAEQADPNVGLDSTTIRKFSMVKAMREMAGLGKNGKRGMDGLTGRELEVHNFASRIYENKDGRHFEGICIPSDITDARADETYQLDQRGLQNLAEKMARVEAMLGRTMAASSFTGGGFLVGTELLAGSFIDYLRNACFIGQGPFAIIELGGLVGNCAIPRQTSTAQTYWLPEGGSSTASDFAGSQLYGTPHRMSVQGSWTKQLMLQSTPAVEMLVRNDQGRAAAVEEDRVIYLGSGAGGEPIGIVNTTGVDASVTFSGNWTQAKSLLFQLAIENANANTIGEMVFATNPTSKSYAMGTVQVSSSTFPIYIWMSSKGEYPTINGSKGGVVLDYGAYATKQLGTRVLFGIYNNNVIKFRWGGIDLMVEPYTGAATETVKSYLNQWMDVGVRYPQAFSYSTDAPTSP